MLKCMTHRRSCASMMNTNRTLKLAVGTVKKSHATRSLTWLWRKAFHVGEGGLRMRGRYFSTVDLATVMPSLRRLPHNARQPHQGIGVPAYLG